jgi:hypothetical protein
LTPKGGEELVSQKYCLLGIVHAGTEVSLLLTRTSLEWRVMGDRTVEFNFDEIVECRDMSHLTKFD